MPLVMADILQLAQLSLQFVISHSVSWTTAVGRRPVRHVFPLDIHARRESADHQRLPPSLPPLPVWGVRCVRHKNGRICVHAE